jgi:hypothetical protein
VSSLPGFVEGRWNRSPDGVRAYNTMVFDDQAAAEGFVGYVRGDIPAASAAGVHLHSVELFDVIGSAWPGTSSPTSQVPSPSAPAEQKWWQLFDATHSPGKTGHRRVRRGQRVTELLGDEQVGGQPKPAAPIEWEARLIAHIAEFAGPAGVLEGIGMQGFATRVAPVLEAQPGFEGYLILLNREKVKLLGVTLWDTKENRRLAGARLEQERRTGIDEMGANSPLPRNLRRHREAVDPPDRKRTAEPRGWRRQ